MPPIGVRPGQLREAERRPAPTPARNLPAYRPAARQVPNYVEVHAPRPQKPTWSAPPAQHPFAQAQHQAAQQVQRQVPQQRIYAPIIPRIPSPTLGQQQTAFGEARRFQERHLGPNATRQQELAFHRQVASDPRNAGFVQALAHYLHAARVAGGVNAPFTTGGEGGARNVIDAAVAASRAESPNERAARERDAQAWAQQGQRELQKIARERQQHAGDLKIPLVGATINPEQLVTALATLKIPGIDALGLGGKLVNEAIDLPGQTALAGAMVGGALRKKVEGEGAPLSALGHELWRQIKDPLGTFKQAPLSTALMFGGIENALGRGVGGAGRLAGAVRAGDAIGPALRTARLGTPRPDMLLYGEKLPHPDAVPNAQRAPFIAGSQGTTEGLRLVDRRYNPDPLRAGMQKAYERALPHLPGAARQADPFQATGWRLKRAVSGSAFHVGLADYGQAANEKGRRSMLRGTVNKVMQGVDHGGVNAKLGRDAIPLIVQGIVRAPGTLAHDLMKERDKLIESLKATTAGGAPAHTGADRGTIKANLERVHGLLNDQSFLKDPSEAFAAAKRFNLLQKPFVAARLFGGQLKVDQLRAALFPYAQAHMGARHFTTDMHAAAEADALSGGLGQHRALQVAGRPPEAVLHHQELEGRLAEAKAAHGDAQKAVLKAQRSYDRRVALQQSARARGSGPPRSSTPAEARAMAAAKAELAGAKQAVREAKVPLREHQQALSEHKLPDREPGMRGPHGEQLTNQMILDHMKANGVKSIGFLSHQRGVSGRGSYFRSTLRQPALASHTRTGAAFAAGSADHSFEALIGTIAKHASEAAQLEGRRRTLNRFGIGQHNTAREAQLAAENFLHTPEGARVASEHSLGDLRQVHVGSQQIVDKGHIAPVPSGDVLHQFGLTEHVKAEHREYGRYTNMPAHVLERMQRHDEALSSKTALGRALQAYQTGFRRAKLNTSMPHEFGVLQEQAIRLLADQVGPMAWATGRKYDRTLKRMAQVDKHGYVADAHGPLGEAYRAFENTLGGRGGLVATQKWQDAHRASDQMHESMLHYAFHAGERAFSANPGKQLVKGWRGWRTVFEGSLAKAEEAAYHGHMGKALRDSGLIDSYRSVLKAQDEAIKAVIDRRMTQNRADALARRIDNMMGNWSHQTPGVRTFVGKFAPFGLWYLNSLRFLYRLPVSHPIKTAVLAGLYSTTRVQRSAEGQGYGAPHPVPGFLQGTISADFPVLGHVKVAPTYYSPGGALGAEFGKVGTEQILPGLTSPYFALRGENPLTGEKLKGPHGEDLNPGQVALNSLAEVTAGPTPFATQAQVGLERGGKRYGTANWITDLLHQLGGPPQVKPGTEHTVPEVLGKMLSPTRVIRPKATPAGGSATLDSLQQHRLRDAEQQAERQLNDPLVKRRIEEAERSAAAAGR